jgi:LDH2 family malate/lactate/ureidoglycolate dehydrogenase
MSARIHLSVAEARALGGLGYDPSEARIIADHVIDAALCGYEYSGLAKILNIPEHARFKLPRRPLSVLHETAISTLYDGGNNVGMLALDYATDAVIAKAQRSGMAVVGLTNSWVSGRSAYYVERIARADLVAIHTASSSRAVAPLGGMRPILGTNPIAFALPAAHDVVVFDMGTSAFMMTELALRERLGQLLPEGVAIDPAGKPTRDPSEAKRGALLPFGAHKGFGLALMVHALGVLAGSALDIDRDNGYLFLVLKPDLLRPLDVFKREMTELVERVKATPRQPGINEIRIPSEQAFRNRARALREGIDIDATVYDSLRRLCGK